MRWERVRRSPRHCNRIAPRGEIPPPIAIWRSGGRGDVIVRDDASGHPRAAGFEDREVRLVRRRVSALMDAIFG